VVLPEELCQRLSELADRESRTVSNMAKVLIQQGVQRYEQGEYGSAIASSPGRSLENPPSGGASSASNDRSGVERIRSALESQQPRRLRGAPRRVRLHRPD
jgi:hypothetical protein